jgi:hypothetical protein
MMANEKALFVPFMDRIPRLKYTEASFSPNSSDLLCLRVAQVPRSREVAIFVLTMMRPITIPLAHVHGVKLKYRNVGQCKSHVARMQSKEHIDWLCTFVALVQ